MFRFPDNFQWLLPWTPLPEDYRTVIPISSPDECIIAVGRAPIVTELRREMPGGHVLSGLELEAVAVHVESGHKDYVFTTNDATRPIASVHLSYSVESDPSWPSTSVFESLSDWRSEMVRDYENAGRPELQCGGKHYQVIGREIDGIEVHVCARCGDELWRPPAAQENE